MTLEKRPTRQIRVEVTRSIPSLGDAEDYAVELGRPVTPPAAEIRQAPSLTAPEVAPEPSAVPSFIESDWSRSSHVAVPRPARPATALVPVEIAEERHLPVPAPSRAVATKTSRSGSHRRRPPRRQRRPQLKKLSAMVLILGALAFSGAGGSFSSFNALTNNAGSSIASGTLTMSNTVNSGTACVTTSSTNNSNNACSAALSLSNLEPGSWSSSQQASIQVQNTGSLNASLLQLYAPSSTACNDSVTTSSPVAGATYGSQLNFNPTSGNPFCAAVQISVQEETNGQYYCWLGDVLSQSGNTQGGSGLCETPMTTTVGTGGIAADGTTIPLVATNGPIYGGNTIDVTSSGTVYAYTVPTADTYPPGTTSIAVNANTNPAISAGAAVTDLTTVTALNGVSEACTGGTTACSLSNFFSKYDDNQGQITLFPLASSGVMQNPATTPELSDLTGRTFVVSLYLPSTSASQNDLQGLQTSFAMTWFMQQ